ncbi:MAG: transglutaminase [Planctomycetes bacterium GWF2_41_51]|nr:MAG: transglutaminase [Planctomycetes bacterium GWF2_41_51]HBG27936.1 transglutaminase [Phycisphaerales bacterium]
MNFQKALPTVLAVCVFFGGCKKSPNDGQELFGNLPIVVTNDIQAGIEKHIEEKTRLGNGFFRINFEDKELQLKLVRVHTEYLSNLGPRLHFACVDMVNTDGDVYDVDFFLAGDPGEMTVNQTTIHKINGQPMYVWKQKRDKTWYRFPVDKAPPELLGVIRGRDEFEFIYRATLPDINDTAKMWLPLPHSDAFQTVKIKSIKATGRQEILNEHEYGNSVLFLELGTKDSGKTIELHYQVQRIEKNVYAEKTSDYKKYLKPESLVPDNETFRSIAERIIQNKKGDLVRARALYDHVIDRMRYMKHGSGWGKGDAVYACDVRTGNCSDYHSYFIALCRAVNIPARFAIGVAIPSERNEGGIDGYHCWVEFYAEGKWWPVDISEADKCSSLSTYYFGHHPANRIELSRGRDLVVEPAPASGPINFLVYPLLEIGGKPAKANVEFSFKRKAIP